MAKEKKSLAVNFDASTLADDFRNMDPNDPGSWPLGPRIVVLVGLFAAVLLASWWFFWRAQLQALEQSRGKEVALQQTWVQKKREAVSLPLLKMQLDETNRQFGALLAQLPNSAEMDSLLQDMNQAGLQRGLQFELFKPAPDIVKDFYAEMPIAINVQGNYDQFGEFADDVARLSRIIALTDLDLTNDQGTGALTMKAKALTYRFMDKDSTGAK